VSRLRIRGAISPFPNTPSWRGAQLKHMDNFTFTLTKCSTSMVSLERSRQRKMDMKFDSIPWG
jgi:hypothetical protein